MTQPIDLSSTAGIVAAVLTLTAIIKRLVVNVPVLKNVPTWLYASMLAAITSGVAVQIGVLQGSLWHLVFHAAISAASASGFHSWYKNFTKSPADSELEKSGVSTNSILLSLVFLIAFSSLLVFPGCGKSPSQQYAMASDTYTVTVNGVVAASQAGLIDFETLQTINKYRQQADIELNAMRTALDEGRKYDFKYALERFLAIMNRIAVLQMEAEKRKENGHRNSLDTSLRSDQDRPGDYGYYPDRPGREPRSYASRNCDHRFPQSDRQRRLCCGVEASTGVGERSSRYNRNVTGHSLAA